MTVDGCSRCGNSSVECRRIELDLGSIFKQCCFLRYDSERTRTSEELSLLLDMAEVNLRNAASIVAAIKVYHPLFAYFISQIRRINSEMLVLSCAPAPE